MRAGHVASLDGWRGVCILMVLAGHFVTGVGGLANIGVELFFVLSGKLMADILIFRQQPIAPFLKRRFARIVPALAFYVLIAALLLNAIFWVEGMPLRLESPIAALLFVHNYLPLSASLPAFEHTWSLAVEEHSYLLLAAIAVVAARRGYAAAALAIGVSVLTIVNGAWLIADPPADSQYLSWRSDLRVRSVLISFAACILMRSWLHKGSPWMSWTVPLAAAASVGLLLWGGDMAAPLAVGGTILAAIAVNGLDCAPAWLRRALECAPLVWLGTLSFSLYLWQQLFYCFLEVGLPAPLGVLLTLVCALWCFKRVEEPARNWLNARWSDRRPDDRAEEASERPAAATA